MKMMINLDMMIRFVADEDIPISLINLLRSLNYYVDQYTELTNPGRPKLHKSIKRRIRFKLTSNKIFLDNNKYPLDKLNKSSIIIFNRDKIIISWEDLGYVICSLIELLEINGNDGIVGLKIVVGNDIKIYSDSFGEIIVTYYKIINQGDSKYSFELISRNYDLQKYLEVLIKKGERNKVLTYDDLYNILPAHVVTADIIDQTVNVLSNHEISVSEQVATTPNLKNTTFEDELKQYEIQVESSLEYLLKNYNEDTETNDQTKSVIEGNEKSIKILNHERIIDQKIPLPHIPNLQEVNPVLVSINNLLIKSKKRTFEKRTDSNTEKKNRILISTNSEMNMEEFKITEGYEIPKTYSKFSLNNDRRISKYAKIVGERSENIVIKYLNQTLSIDERRTLRWTSKEGETPGWDIEYINLNNNFIAIEVKGTTGDFFPNIEITNNEWNSAIDLKERYCIYLVTNSLSNNPQIQRIQNRFHLNELGSLTITPLLWKVEMFL